MATDLTTLAIDIKDLTRWQLLPLTDTENLARLNRMYRWMATLTEFPEFRRKDVTRSTTANTGTVTWPTLAFSDVRAVELQDPDDNDEYKLVPKARSELDWAVAALEPNGWPWMWQDGHDGTNNQIEFRPIPDFAKTVRFTGYIVPTALGASDSTAFRTREMDDALANLFAGDLLLRRNQMDLAQMRLSSAQQIIRRVTGREIQIVELAQVAQAA